ncbi:hypothetical protein K2D_08100 [Planctomycetes bacterium K2D]|nr:hypothetical protein K2D_08100 [Planctomycetes bacterium K2D]
MFPLIRQWTVATLLCLAGAAPGSAAITATGDYRPAYDGVADPWDLGTTTDIYVGEDLSGSLTIDGGSDVANDDTYVGYEAPAVGEVTVTGAGSTWTSDSWVYLGYSGTGSLTVADNADVTAYSAYLGYSPTGQGTATITGAGSTWTLEYSLDVGDRGDGELSVLDSARVYADRLAIADGSGSTGGVTVSGDDSRLEVEGYLYVGYSGSGALQVEEGGWVFSEDVYLGRSSNGAGQATITGPGSQLIATNGVYIGSGDVASSLVVEDGAAMTVGILAVGDNREGTLRVGSAATVNATNLYVGRGFSGSGEVQLDGGVIATRGLLAAPSDLQGTGVINTNGLVADFDVTIATAADRNQQWVFNESPEQNVTVNLDLETAGGALGAGYRGASTLSIAGGQVVSSELGEVGYHDGAVGTVVVSGVGSRWNVTNRMTLGRYGVGNLSVEGGGVVAAGSIGFGSLAGNSLSVGAESKVLVTGDLTVVGGGGGGLTLDDGEVDVGGLLATPSAMQGVGVIRTGGLVTDFDITFDATHGLSQQFQLVDEQGKDITIELQAPVGSANARGAMGAGYRGQASLSISDGRVIYSRSGHLGYHQGSSGVATLTGRGSAWLMYGSLDVGAAGNGELSIKSMAHVQSQTTRIGGRLGSTGVIHVERASLSTTDVFIDRGGSLIIEDGANVFSSFRAEIGPCCGSGGTGAAPSAVVSGEGSEWNVGSYLTVAGGSPSQGVPTPELRIEDGGRVDVNEARISDYYGEGQLTITGVGSVLDANSLRVNAQPQQSDGVPDVLVERGGRVVVNNYLYLFNPYPPGSNSLFALRDGGQLALTGFRESSLSQFLAGTVGSLSYWDGDSYEDLASAQRDVDYTLAYQSTGELAGYTLLTVGELPGLDGDYNGDGLVDAADYTVWRDNFGQDVTLPGDTTPGAVTQQDYAVWAANYGASRDVEAALSTPEPVAAVLVGVAVMGAGLRRPRR